MVDFCIAVYDLRDRDGDTPPIPQGDENEGGVLRNWPFLICGRGIPNSGLSRHGGELKAEEGMRE
jgi:hypothetical protein